MYPEIRVSSFNRHADLPDWTRKDTPNPFPTGIMNLITIAAINPLRPSDAYMHHRPKPSSVQITWSAPSHYLNQWWNIVNLTFRHGTNFSYILIKFNISSRKRISKCRLPNWRPVCLGLTASTHGSTLEPICQLGWEYIYGGTPLLLKHP